MGKKVGKNERQQQQYWQIVEPRAKLLLTKPGIKTSEKNYINQSLFVKEKGKRNIETIFAFM